MHRDYIVAAIGLLAGAAAQTSAAAEDDPLAMFAEMMPVETDDGRAEFWRRLKRWGVSRALRQAGARPGDRVRFGDVELEIEA